jgi:hypothetical protein
MKEVFRISSDRNKSLTELINSSSLDWHKFHMSKINEIIFYELEKEDLNNGGEQDEGQ